MSTGSLLFQPLPHRFKGNHITSPPLGRVTHKQSIAFQGHEPYLVRVDPVLQRGNLDVMHHLVASERLTPGVNSLERAHWRRLQQCLWRKATLRSPEFADSI
jgi:hypothetical protein